MRVIVPALLASAALLLASVPAASPAQEVVQPLPGTTDADRLAEQMRALGSPAFNRALAGVLDQANILDGPGYMRAIALRSRVIRAPTTSWWWNVTPLPSL